jgi:hypothetical protein
MPETAPDSPDLINQRRDLRVAGPFDGQWVGALTVPLRIHDLSLGGCLIQAYHEQAPGRRFTLEIELPLVGQKIADLCGKIVKVMVRDDCVRIGIEFSSMSPEQRAAVQLFVQLLIQGSESR